MITAKLEPVGHLVYGVCRSVFLYSIFEFCMHMQDDKMFKTKIMGTMS